MYVCICNAVTERTIYQLVAEGMTSISEIEAATGCSGACGTCREFAESVVHKAVRKTHPLPCIPMVAEYSQPA